MKKELRIPEVVQEIELVNQYGEILVSSREVAKNFGKRHSDTIKAIEDKMEVNEVLRSPKYFIESTYIDRSNRKSKEYLMTRDGFSFIVMGFNGVKADKWKIKYIDAFNKMESTIKNQISQLDKKDSLILSLVKDGCKPLELAEYTKLVEQEGIAKGLNGESRLMNLGQVVKILNKQYLENKNLTTMMLNEFMADVLGWGKFKVPKGNKVRREFIPNEKFIDMLVVKGGSYTGKTDKNNKIKIQYSVDMVDYILKYKSQLEQFINENL